MNIAFGQIFYIDKALKPSNTDDSSSDETAQNGKTNYSAWAMEMDFNYDDFLFYHGGVQYDVDSSALQLANSTLEYRFGDGFIQTNYRYVTKEYIEDTVGDSINVSSITQDGISQAGIIGGYQLSKKWYASAQYFHDLTTDEALEWLANLRYTSDCWYMGFTYSNQLKSWGTTSVNSVAYYEDPTYENNFSFNIGIIGFGTSVGAGSSMSGLDGASSSIKYGRPFFLNN